MTNDGRKQEEGESAPVNGAGSEPVSLATLNSDSALAQIEEATKSLAARLELPLVEAALRRVHFRESEIQAWLLRLSEMKLSDEELALLLADEQSLAPAPAPARRSVRRQFALWRHRASHVINHKKPAERLLYMSGWLTVLVGAMAQSGFAHWWTWVGAGVVALMKSRGFWKEIDPSNMPMLRRTLNERQLLLHKLLHASQLWRATAPSENEIQAFYVDTLQLIASFVRDHRSDLKGRMIFVNLLVPRGDGVEVIARSDPKRPVPKSYTKEECSLVWAAIDTGTPQATGDLQADAPATAKGKKYKSVLVLPIRLKNQVLGAVSIDSENSFHFEGWEEELHTQLAPYVQLFAAAIHEERQLAQPATTDHDRTRRPLSLPRRGEELNDGQDVDDQ